MQSPNTGIMPRAPSQPFGAQATLEYSRERRQRKAKEKEAAAAEKARIQEWQKKLVRGRYVPSPSLAQ
jgi:hypothetical protein